MNYLQFWNKVSATADPNQCWDWTGFKNRDGYGVYSGGNGKRTTLAHRIAWEQFNGSIPRELQADHLCRNRACVNPGHLEMVTHIVNTMRGVGFGPVNLMKTTCPSGHPYSGENLLIYSGGRKRRCRRCHNAASAKHYRVHGKTVSSS